MAQPSRRSLRAARRRGLTSPEPVSTPTAPPATPNPAPEPGTPDKPHNRRAVERPRPESPRKNSSRRNQAGNELPELAGGSRLRRPGSGLVEPHFPADGLGQVAPRTSVSLMRYWSTSASSDSTSAAMPGASMTRGLLRGQPLEASHQLACLPGQRHSEVLWRMEALPVPGTGEVPQGGRQVAQAVAKIVSATHRREPTASGGRVRPASAESPVHRVDHAAAESSGEQDLVDVAGEPVEIARII